LALRAEAFNSGAPRYDPRNWQAAENIFTAAAQKLEAGRVDAARAQAREATPLYEMARWTSWRTGVMQGADSLILRLDQLGARQYAPRSYVRAVDARTAAEKRLETRGRADSEVHAAGARAASEARHALYLVERIRGVCDKTATDRLEDSVLEWEDAVGRALGALGLEASFERGLAAPLGTIEKEAQRLRRERDTLRTDSSQQTGTADSLRTQVESLRDTLRDRELQIAALRRVQQEQDTLARVQRLFGRDEGRVLLDDRDVILRLHGLQFASGKADLPPEATPLLTKVAQVVKLLPGARLVVEGHTDEQGKPDANLQLSQQRAAAVRSWLVQNAGLEPARMTALGFGASRPVATNDTEEGRTLNRRIEIILARPQ
jgi:outer membrane protein OmpA-like peptidoglycan-associated protein